MILGPSFSWAFVISMISLIFSGFPLTCFHLTEASNLLFCIFSYTIVCAVVREYHEMFLFIIIYLFSTCFAMNLFYLQN